MFVSPVSSMNLANDSSLRRYSPVAGSLTMSIDASLSVCFRFLMGATSAPMSSSSTSYLSTALSPSFSGTPMTASLFATAYGLDETPNPIQL